VHDRGEVLVDIATWPEFRRAVTALSSIRARRPS
jgi:hypothetical protein